VALLDAPVDGRGNPANLFGHELAGTMHVADHLAAFHLAGHDCAALDAGRGGLELRQYHRYDAYGGKRHYQIKDAANALVAFDFFIAWNVHNHLHPLITNCRAKNTARDWQELARRPGDFCPLLGLTFLKIGIVWSRLKAAPIDRFLGRAYTAEPQYRNVSNTYP
jgi:hypothetical protein